MRVLFTAVLSFLAVGAAANNNSAAPSITGYYLTHDDTAKVLIYQDGATCQGKAVWNAQHGDVAKQNIIVLRDLTFNAKKKAWTGKLFDPFDNREYNVAVRPLSGGELQVVPSLGFVSRTLVWHKVDEK